MFRNRNSAVIDPKMLRKFAKEIERHCKKFLVMKTIQRMKSKIILNLKSTNQFNFTYCLTFPIYIYIYIYVCVCVCVNRFVENERSLKKEGRQLGVD